MRLRHFFPISAIALIGLGAMPLLAQTSDDFYDPSVLQDVRITMDPNDWNTLKQNFRLDTVYPASFQWRGVTVNNVGIRSHGTGSRNGIKPALFLNIDY